VHQNRGVPIELKEKETEGWLEFKGGGVFDGWKSRYVVLVGSRLLSFKRKEEKEYGSCKTFNLHPESLDNSGLIQMDGKHVFQISVRYGKDKVKQYLVGSKGEEMAMRWYLTLLSTCGVRAPKEPLFCDRQNIAKALLDVPVNQPKNLYSSTAKLKEGVTEYMTPDRLCKSVIPRWMTLPSGKKRDKAKAEFAKYKLEVAAKEEAKKRQQPRPLTPRQQKLASAKEANSRRIKVSNPYAWSNAADAYASKEELLPSRVGAFA